MTKRPRRARAASADPLVRLHYAAMHNEALRLARYVSVGFDLTPGDLERLGRMPADVQRAVLAQQRTSSRYLPLALQRHRAALEQARAEGRSRIEPKEWNPALDRHLSNPDAYDDPGRVVTVQPPGNTNGSREIIAAIAAGAGVTPATIRAWAEDLQEALDEAAQAEEEKEARKEGRAPRPRRRKDARRRPAGKRASE